MVGTFEHIAQEVIDLQVEDQEKPIGCTPTHPIWSKDREEFVPAGELFEGERVRTLNGDAKRVVQKLPRPGPEVVYNLEVFDEHVYLVTNDGVLVHNYRCGGTDAIRNTAGRLTVSGEFNDDLIKKAAKYLPDREYKSFRDCRETLWMTIASHAELSKGFSKSNIKRMRNGWAPYAIKSKQVGGRKKIKIHHIEPLKDGGGLYDLSNFMLLDPKSHIALHKFLK